MNRNLRNLLPVNFPAEEPKVPRRHASITDNEDGVVYTLRSNGMYETDTRKFLSIPMANDIIAGKPIEGKPKGFTLSAEEAPVFHVPLKKPRALHRGGLSTLPSQHPLLGNGTGRHRDRER